jgi:uncharacterized phage protein (TIGR01671 family)
MRKILFRGKEIETGKWIYGAFVPDALEGPNDLVSWGFIRNYNEEICHMQTIEVDRETVGQFTGLTDKNGKSIFEGDILTDRLYSEKIIGHVIFGIDAFFIRCNGYEIRLNNVQNWAEIVGNIHDNPDLLGDPHEHH